MDKKPKEIHDPYENLTTILYTVNSYITITNVNIRYNWPAAS